MLFLRGNGHTYFGVDTEKFTVEGEVIKEGRIIVYLFNLSTREAFRRYDWEFVRWTTIYRRETQTYFKLKAK